MWLKNNKLYLVIIAILMLILIGVGVTAAILLEESSTKTKSSTKTSSIEKSSTQISSTKTPLGGMPLLPGQQIWKNGVSSYLFGTNDTEEWEGNNVETNSSMQQYLKAGHFTLMRTFFFHNSIKDQHEVTDQEVQQRINTVTNSGMQCLGVIPNIRIEAVPTAGNKYTDLGFAKHLVSLLDGTHAGFGACNMYEIGNEPDLTADASNYVREWNTFVKELKAINPHAKFMGPVSYKDNKGYIQWFLQGAQSSDLLPDAVTFHSYGCSNEPVSVCLQHADNYDAVINNVRNWVRSTLKKDLPIGMTEWNMDPGSNATLGNDPVFMREFTMRALQAMIRAHLDFANQFDAMSYAGYGTLDMFNIFWGPPYNRSAPKAQYYAMVDMINRYKP